ncbi:hypothetical protein AVEN_59419-1 [Araneus ventricosus]|uniref:Uncharacterized protein n=1 Tax=Araneus ventricosus TaxID=182803 RepID=A0A4Y2KJI9_ARAVE|nr:hypothetical protein AVEN_59419-1 [Araneus ventricosus]
MAWTTPELPLHEDRQALRTSSTIGGIGTQICNFSIAKGSRSRFFLMIPCDTTACPGDYKRTALGSQSSSVLIDWNDFGVSSAVRAGKAVS